MIYHLIKLVYVKYKIYQLLKAVYARLSGKSCGTCMHYDGVFGEDCCFECERSVTTKGYGSKEKRCTFRKD